MKSVRDFILCITSFSCVAALPLAARGETDACTLLTAAQVSAAVGTPVGEGTHVTPTFVKTCTWTPSAKSKVVAVTLNLQTATWYDGSKRQATMGAAIDSKAVAIKPASVGDDAYYSVTGDQAMLFVKRGANACKVSVYARLPAAEKEAMELKLAREVAGKL